MHKLLLIFFCSFLIISCDNTKNKKANGTYLGGVIENPRVDYVILSHNDKVIDTINLDDNNRFSYKNDSLCEGLYTFKHREYQRFYLEKNDSILLHINTIDFDESLKYSGIGAEKNNLLMKIFLDNEKVQKKLTSWFVLSPTEYLGKLDSVNKAHGKFCTKYSTKTYDSSDSFNQIVDANLTYDMYLWKELYISSKLLDGNAAIQEQLPAAFLTHRKEIDFGNDLMRSHYSYYRFLDNYYNNVAFNKYKNVDSFDRENYTHASSKMLTINNLTNNEPLRNKLLRRSAIDYLLHTTDVENATKLFNQFKGFSSNKENIEELEHILDNTLKIVPGSIIPDVQLVGIDNQTKTLHTVIKRPTVIYFWTYESTTHYREVHDKANYLKIKYPNYDFIAINADDNFRKWRKIVETISTDKNTEYQLDNLSSAKSVLILDTPERTIIVDADGTIKNASAEITDLAFEDVL